MKKFFTLFLICLFLGQLIMPTKVFARDLRGLILLQVESRGEAWYVSPVDGRRYSLGTPSEAFAVLRALGLGVRHSVIKVPPRRLVGRILIDTDDQGKAYYFSPTTKKLYYLGKPKELLTIMRSVGLGVSNGQLQSIPAKITINIKKNLDTQLAANTLEMEKKIQELVSDERQKKGLSRLKWNDDLAAVAREHSQDQADENRKLIDQNKYCSFPFIHHEGLKFGLYHSDRLSSRNVYYQSASAENIALIPRIKSVSFEGEIKNNVDCQKELEKLNNSYKKEVEEFKADTDKVKRLRSELVTRQDLLAKSEDIQLIKSFFNTSREVEEKSVVGWMNSPGHRQNILHGAYDEAGVGLAEVNGYYIITQVFIERAICGYKGGGCCQKSGYLPYCYVPWSCGEDSMCQ